MNHTPLERNIREKGPKGTQKSGIPIQTNQSRIIQSSSFQMKEKGYPAGGRFSSTKNETKKLSLSAFGDSYGTQKGFFANPVPPDFQVDRIQEQIPDRLLDRPVEVREKFLFQGFIKIRDGRGAVLYAPESFANSFDFSGGDSSQENIRQDLADLILSSLPSLEDRGKEALSSSGDANSFDQIKSCLKVLKKKSIAVIFPFLGSLIRKASNVRLKLFVNRFFDHHSDCIPDVFLQSLEEVLKTFRKVYVLMAAFLWTRFNPFRYTFCKVLHTAYPPFWRLIPGELGFWKDKPFYLWVQ